MNDPPICPICNNPKQANSSGSFTQWISVCSCDLKDSKEAQELSLHICTECGKRIGEGRQGSFTQFIFRTDTCQCKNPSPGLHRPHDKKNSDLSEVAIEAIELIEQELEIEKGDFPVDRYKPIELLGRGANGQVFKARDRLLNKLVAVKTINLRTPEQLVKFQTEAKATNALKHPSILQIMDFGITSSEVPYMVLEYFQAKSVEEIIEEKGALQWWQVKTITSQVCSALSYAHKNKIYHRDLKPGNILLHIDENENITVKVIDFGIALVAGADKMSRDHQGNTIIGTPYYMSPDQGLGLKFDSRSEVYSYGCVLFEMLTGKLPFSGETPVQTLNMHAKNKPPKLSEITGLLFRDEIEHLVSKCLEKEPSDRFDSFNEIANYIDDMEISTPAIESKTDRAAQKKKSFSGQNFLFLSTLLILIFSGIYFAKTVIDKKIDTEAEKQSSQEDPVAVYKSLSTPLEDHVFAGEWKVHKTKSGARVASGSGVSDDQFKELLKHKNISKLKVKLSDQVTGEGLVHLKGWDLKSIEIVSTKFNDSGAKELTNFPNLKNLSLKFSHNLSSEGMKNIGKLTRLKRLQLWKMGLPENSCEVISGINSLSNLDLGYSRPITLEGVRKFKKLPKLKAIKLAAKEIYDDKFGEVLANTTIKTFLLNETSITMKTVEKLAKRKETKFIRVSLGKDITKEKLRLFKKKFPHVKFQAIDMYKTNVSL